MQKRRGFTTVELVIVIAVIAILATALIPTFGGLIDSANHTADVQTAKNLTTLVLSYSMDHKIECERDLANAINEGMKDPNYYLNLKAKSAKDGYCFWYNYKTNTVELGTVEEIDALSKTQMAYQINSGDVTLANGFTGSTNFVKGLRTDLVPGFFLMGYSEGNELLDLVINLENASLETYQTAHEAVTGFNSEDTYLKAAVANLATNLSKTLIHNDFARIVPSGTIESVHIPFNVLVLNRTTTITYNGESVTDGVTDVEIVTTVYLPDGVSAQLGALNYLAAGSNVNVNASSEEMKELIDGGAINADVHVHTNDGDTWKQLDSKWVNAITGTVLGDCSNSILLGSFTVSIPTGDGYVFPGKNGAAGTIYVSQDLKNFSLTANSFMDTNNEAFPESGLSLVQWSFDGNSMQSGSVLSCSMPHTNGGKVTVEANGVKYTYNVKTFEATTFGIYSLGGATSIDYYLDYTPGKNQDWTIVPQFGCTDGLLNGLINLETKISIVADADTAFDDMFTITANGKLQFNGAKNPEISGDQTGTLTLKCRGLTTTVDITLVDESDAVFSIADRANTQKEYGFTFTVGTVNDIPLEYLFDAPDTSKGDVIITANRGGELARITSTTNYSEEKLSLAGAFTDGGTEMTIELTMQYASDDSSARTLALRLINGATNVTSAEEWAAASASSSIAVLNGFEINAYVEEEGKNWLGRPNGKWEFSSSASTTKANTYVKNIGANAIYGNFQRIDVSFFKIYAANTNTFIRTEGGKIEQLILVGPDYGNDVAITGQMDLPILGEIGDGYKKGTHVSAVAAKNAIIRDSFISGFRAPVTANGGTLKIYNTTLNRGNYANIDVAHGTTMYLDGVTTIQYHGEGGNIAAGIAFKYNSNTSKLIATNLTQHNYYTKTDIQNICNAAANVVPVVSVDIPLTDADYAKANEIAHTINDTTHYHAGIFEIGLDIVIDVKVTSVSRSGTPSVDIGVNDYDGNNRVDANASVVGVNAGSVSVNVTGLESCDTCNHTILYTNENFEQNLSDFKASH